MLIDQLRNDVLINRHFCSECRENNVGIEIDANIGADDIVIINVDEFYAKNAVPQPKSPDCLIVQRCSHNSFILYIVELKNIDSPGGFKVEHIVEKFTNCLADFMYIRFPHYFRNPDINYININLIFIADPYDFKNVPVRQEKMTGYKLDALLAVRIPKYFGKYLYINHKLPNPKINNCKKE